MDRPGNRWMMVGVCAVLVLAGTAWAQPKRGQKHQPRPLERSVETERHREHREREPEPELIIFRLEHIPAESVMDTLKQLGRSPHLREMLEQIPVGCNEPSNAIVVIGPPKVIEIFERLIKGLDQPCEFHERMRDREMGRKHQELELHAEMKRREVELKTEMAKRHAEIQTRAGREAPPHGRPDAMKERLHRALSSPVGEVLERLLSPAMREKLDLGPDQIERIRKLAGGFHEKLTRLRERVVDGIREMAPPERERQAGGMVEEARRYIEELTERVHRELHEILRPEQRERLHQLRPHGPEHPEPKERDARQREMRERENREREEAEHREREMHERKVRERENRKREEAEHREREHRDERRDR